MPSSTVCMRRFRTVGSWAVRSLGHGGRPCGLVQETSGRRVVNMGKLLFTHQCAQWYSHVEITMHFTSWLSYIVAKSTCDQGGETYRSRPQLNFEVASFCERPLWFAGRLSDVSISMLIPRPGQCTIQDAPDGKQGGQSPAKL
eukprot:360572-Chlamydomonas_euryale.AAC.6